MKYQLKKEYVGFCGPTGYRNRIVVLTDFQLRLRNQLRRNNMREKLNPCANPKEFAAAVVPFLKLDEPRYNVALGIVDTLTQRPDVYKEYYLAALRDSLGKVAGAVFLHIYV